MQFGDEGAELGSRYFVAGFEQADHTAQYLLVGLDPSGQTVDKDFEFIRKLESGGFDRLLVHCAPQQQRQAEVGGEHQPWHKLEESASGEDAR